MRVSELAKDLGVRAEALIHLLREMGIPVGGATEVVSDADVSRVLARMERERRAGFDTPKEALAAAIEDSKTAPRRRRRRRKAKPAPKPEERVPAEATEDESELQAEAAQAPSEAESPDEAPEVEEPTAEVADVVEPEAPEPAEAEAPVEAEPEAEEAPVAEAEEAVAAEVEAPAEPEPAEASPAAPKPASVRDLVGDARPVRRVSTEAAQALRKPKPAASAGPGGQVRIQAEGYTSDGRRHTAGKKKGKKRQRVDQDAVQSNIQRVMAEIKGGGSSKKRRKARQAAQAREARETAAEEALQEAAREAKTVKVNEFLTVAELAELVDVSSTEIIGSAFKNLGMMVTINQRLDFDQIELLLDEFGMTAVKETEYGAEPEEVAIEEDAPEDLEPRPPVVTVMGHVDHGKTLLLDSIRNANVVAGEAGGITQHIGAYHVELPDGRTISFLDTPGHAAFTAMRARGADVTDLVILVVAADDSVMPQTIEAISHAKNAGVPLIVAVNKIDLPSANPSKVKQELLQHDVTLEEFGGDVLSAEISAKTGQGIDDLLEKVLLQAELLELKANPNRDAVGAVIEARLDVGKGAVTTVLVERGTLSVGDSFVVGHQQGRVRAMLDERGNPVESAGPSIPVQVLGASGVPQAGDTLTVMDADKAAEIAGTRSRLEREKQLRIRERGFKLGDFSQLRAEGQASTLPLIIKGDVDGSVQALSDALQQLGTDEVRVDIIHRAVGAINEEDVLLAGTGRAVIIGFRVRPTPTARQMAERDGIDYHVYDVIYDAVDEVKSALEGLLAPDRREKVHGTAEVREVFKITKVGTIAGCLVIDGVIDRKGKARLIRDGIVTYDGEISSLKRFKDDTKEVREGFECGIGIANYNDIKVGDVIECYTVEEVARTLA